MSNSATVVVDARIPPPTHEARIAKRRPTLDGELVILFDNDKLRPEYGPYRVIFDVVRDELTKAYPDVRLDYIVDDLLVGGIERMAQVAESVASRGPAGVVLALCDWGVSQPSAIFAAELERRGVPTSIIATEVGTRQVAASAQFLAPGLPVSTIQAARGVTADELVERTTRLAPDIIEGITASTDRLFERFEALNLPPPPMGSASGLLEIEGEDPGLSYTLYMEDLGLGDGMPLVAPTESRVNEFLKATDLAAEEVVWPAIPPRSVPVTGRQVAAVAVMAGCRPQWAPVVVAAFRAMAIPDFKLFQSAITTHPGGTLVFVSGPGAKRYGIASGRGCLGPGFPANATTGRAVALSHSFLLGSQPGRADLTSQGSPAEYSYCCAENIEASPWPGLHADVVGAEATTVTVLKCEGPHNLLEDFRTDPADILDTFASAMATLAANNAYVSRAQSMLLLNPDHAHLLARTGWAKSDVQNYLFDVARNPQEDLEDRGIARIQPPWFHAVDRVPIVQRPEDILIVVVGGGGPASQVATPWGYSRASTVTVG